MDLHQCRHWYVNQSLIEIHEQARKGKMTVERGEEELIAYMHWRSGEKVLKAYNHYYQPAGHAAVQNSVFKKLRSLPAKPAPTTQHRKRKQEAPRLASALQQDAGQEMTQQQTSAALYAFLTGKGGYTDELIEDLLATD
jgi:hypothetical protein